MEEFVSRIFSIHHIATIIKDARIARGWTQEQMAAQSGFSRVWINRFEQSAISDPSFRRILTMCDVLNVDLSASYIPGKRTLPTGRSNRQATKHGNATITRSDKRIMRAQTVMEATAILEALAKRTDDSSARGNEVEGS